MQGGKSMAEKKNASKKQPTKKVETKLEEKKEVKSTPKVQEEVVREEKKDYTEILNKILLCLYALIVILVVNTTILLVKGSSANNDSTPSTQEESTEYDVSMFTSVTADTLADAVASDTAKILYIGRSTCGYCVQFLPVLEQAQKDYGYETLYLDITTVTTTEQQDKILAFDNEEEFLKQNFGGTPMVLIMKDGKMIGTWIGYAEYSTYASWLEENGFAKK